MTKKIKKNNNNWKPIELEGSIGSTNLEGLVGIEELCDYDIDSVVKSNNKRKKLKRKSTENESQLEQHKKLKLSPKTKVEKSISNEPGSFVRNPNFTPVKHIKENKKKIKKKPKLQNKNTEIGQTKNDEGNEAKCSMEDLCAWSMFSLPEELLKGLADLGFTKPTHIQQLTLPPAILGRRDILGAAETGSGKTLAFGLPILTGILKFKENEQENSENTEENLDENENSDDSEESDFEANDEEAGIGCIKIVNNIDMNVMNTDKNLKPLYALILTPTRELAVQVKNHLTSVAKYTNIRVAVVLGGMAQVKQERILSKCPEIVVATPGRLWELIQEGNPHLSQVDNIKYLAIDETDRMVEKYHFEELHHLLDRLNTDESKRKLRQNFVFSATLTLVHDLPKHLLKKKSMKMKRSNKITKLTSEQKIQNIIEMLGINNPKIVDVTQQTGTAKTLTESRINCDIDEKDYYVYYFLQKHPGRTLIFCNSIGCVKRLATLLSILKCNTLPLHASMAQRQRLKNLERFRDDPHGVLVATDVAARGLDIPKVDHVLHYQTPRTSEGYIHRSGRTARASEEGITILLIEPNELPNYLKLCKTLERTEDLPHFPVQENILTAVKQRVNLARRLDKLELETRRTNSETGWLQKAAKEMDIILDEDEFSVNVDKEAQSHLKRQMSAIRYELNSFLGKPIFPKGFSIKYPTSSGQLNIPFVQGDQTQQTALDVMKIHLKDSANLKNKSARKLFKKKVKPISKLKK